MVLKKIECFLQLSRLDVIKDELVKIGVVEGEFITPRD